MGQIKKHHPVKLFAGFIFSNDPALVRAELILKQKFGKIDFSSAILPFTHTSYYEKELGADLKRKFVSFQRLINPQQLSRVKIITNKIEKNLSGENGRLINIDPGYLNLSKLVLASTKDYSHRIYLNNGIYAEVTLLYRDGGFYFLEWTYPDYKSAEYTDIFIQIRKIYASQIKNT